MSKLKAYASGNGALSLVWLSDDGLNCESGLFSPTLRDALVYLATDEQDGKRFAAEGWRAVVINTQPVLIGVIIRLGPDSLYLKDGNSRVRYVIDESRLFKNSSTPYGFHCLTMYTEYEGREVEVKNQSMKQGVVFFLNHEAEITRQLAEQDAKTD